mmetsp:Transcript_20326/g.57248  ORF Transcript_20326/g.57248 Transcript_20326/m.57248 type:complete len:145 (+) Transcript_20326:77-511(+)|eukprot:CAMPEP_0119120766 /NCGR_PEP_ID=MMETSP1310-20130426/1677_1 /TAXON_ID=464262 /ORGANISM="Genus nov. species nov., Strain RCC2339" /LENGTH=144 /DNA_ID=CAMNT_0007110271 /DNA_START=78 /DNA_END=512 /DNA_ORIENTATION=+
MKFNSNKTASRRKNRKAHFTAPSSVRRVLMSAHLSRDLREKHKLRALPIRKNDEVYVARGTYKGVEGKVSTVYRKKWVIHIERHTREKKNGQTVNIGILPSNCYITKLHMDKDRERMITRKSRPKLEAKGGKHTGGDVAMAEQD